MVTDRIPGTPRGGRTSRRIAIGLVVVLAVGLLAYGFFTALNHMGATIQRYFRTVGAGDSVAACAMLTDSGQAKIIAQEGTVTCEQAVTHWRASLTPAQLDWLVHGRIWVNGFAAEDSRKEIELLGNPLGIRNWAIYKHAGQETISDWGPEAQKIPPAAD